MQTGQGQGGEGSYIEFRLTSVYGLPAASRSTGAGHSSLFFLSCISAGIAPDHYYVRNSRSPTAARTTVTRRQVSLTLPALLMQGVRDLNPYLQFGILGLGNLSLTSFVCTQQHYRCTGLREKGPVLQF